MSCKVCTNETVRSQVDRMISEGVSDEGISRALASVGADIGKSSILRHRTNHYQSDADHSSAELPPDMDVPKPAVGQPGFMGDEPAKLLDEVRQGIANGNAVDVTRDRLVRETLLSRIYESQLAITAAALDRFQTGEGRYPLDLVKGLQSVATMFEKTSLQTVTGQDSQTALFEREVDRRLNIVFEDARNRALEGGRVPTDVPREHLPEFVANAFKTGYSDFRFGGRYMEGTEFVGKIADAWSRGRRRGIAERKQREVLNDVDAD